MATYNSSIGFSVIPLKYSAESSAQHMVFLKQHAVREKNPDKPTDKTLFMLNVPPYCTEEALKNAWSECGTVKSVYFHLKPNSSVPPSNESEFFPTHEAVKGFKIAYVVFEKPSELQAALKWNQPLVLSTLQKPLICGVRKWFEEYNSQIPNTAQLQSDIDKYMADYDKKAAKEEEAEEEDEDGWITVSKRGRNPGFARKETVTKKILAQEEKRRSKKQLLNFYSFQIRESKMKNLVSLRQKFEEDKKKIQLIKQTRKFKPF